MSMRLFLIPLLVLFFGTGPYLGAQTFNFSTYNSSMGLPQNYVYSLAQDQNGYIWMATAEGLARFDGIKMESFFIKDGLADDFTRKVVVTAQNRVWFGHNNGSISCFEGNAFKKITLDEATAPIRDMAFDKQGNLWAVEQNKGLIKIQPDQTVHTFFDRRKFGRHIYYAVAPVSANLLLVGTSEGLFHAVLNDRGEPERLDQVADLPLTGINCIVQRPNDPDQFWVGTEDSGFFKYAITPNQTKIFSHQKLCISYNLGKENVQQIVEDTDGNLLLATWGNGILKLLYNPGTQNFDFGLSFNTQNGLNNNHIRDILIDRESNYWFATYGGGVHSLVHDFFSFYRLEEIGFKKNKVMISILAGKSLWMGMETGLLKVDPHCFANHEYYDRQQGLPGSSIKDFAYQNGTLWVATAEHGLFCKKDEEIHFRPVPYSKGKLELMVNQMAATAQHLYLATQGGLIVLDLATNQTTHFTTERGLPHNNINFVYLDEQGGVWLGPKDSGITQMKGDSFEVHRLAETPVNVADMTIDSKRQIWLATYNKGVMCYTADTLIHYTVQEGLEKNYCYAIEFDSKNRLWISHHPGLSTIDPETKKIRKFSYGNGINGEFNQIKRDDKGELWIAGSEGVIHYFPESDKPNFIPPFLNFAKIQVSGKTYPANQSIELPYPYGKRPYKFSFEFIGISFKDPSNVRYEYALIEPGEKNPDWTALGHTNFKDYDFLPDGEHQFLVRAYNSDGVMSTEPVAIGLKIQNPFWKKFWFYLICIFSLSGIAYLIMLYREKQLRDQKRMLEEEVANQTVVLRHQKAEIERKNRDITDSINYAQRIQRSILPHQDNLLNSFSESFIFFRPRDIVSGDFYWFNQVNDSFVICCADCTGHGVPGAFMSMIGSTILNDIFKLPAVDSPAALLERLDNEIKIMLNRNQNIEANDGMDISVIEINTKTLRIRVASAKRPVYLYLDGEFNEYKGNRRSIGDKNADHRNAPFHNIVYDGKRGDTIYLFSDGYSDQFGGSMGKKFMTTGVKNFIASIVDKPMQEQGNLVSKNFMEWKGSNEQIDDVIFLGIRL